MRRAGPAALLAAAIALGASSAPAVGAPTAAGDPLRTTLRHDARALVDAGVPGVVVLARRPGANVSLAAGVADAATADPMRVDDRFRIGSLTKTYASVVVLQLVAEGTLRLDDSVERWLPGAVPGGSAITVRELLDHSSGIPDYLE